VAIDKIITQKTLNYIETLYVYANLQDFLSSDDPIDSYSKVLNLFFKSNLESSLFLGTSHGRDWYQLPNYRIGIMDYDKAKIANQFNVEIQYTQSHMFTLDPMLKGLDLPFDGALEQYHIKRIDISQIVKTPHDYLTNHNYISPYRAMTRFDKSGKTETIYLGHRKSGNVFRMYNKTIELKTDTKDHPISYNKIELFSQYFGDIENLYTFELELHRKYLKPTFGIETLADLDKVYKAYREIVGKIKIYEDTDCNKKLIASKNHKRIKDLFCFVEYKEFKRISKKNYKTSESYMIDKAVGAFERYEDSLEEPLGLHGKLLVVDKILSRIFGDKDISIELDDSEHIEQHIELMSKLKILSDNQNNELFKEANEAFAPIMLQSPDDLF